MKKNRTEILIGREALESLNKSNVSIIGVGGVGGHTCEMLARAGVGNLTLVDFDVVDVTNINRQVVADTTTVGRFKAEVMKEVILKINPNCNVKVVNERFTNDFADRFFADNKFDFVVDAIDSVKDKIDLICCCKNRKINIVSACGAGNRIGIPSFKIVDIYKTSYDGLAKVMRKNLRERGVNDLAVAISEEPAMTKSESKIVGSISYYPAMCGCVLSAYVIQELLK